MNSLDKAMKNLRESKKVESDKLAKLVEKKTLKEKVILSFEDKKALQNEIDAWVESLGVDGTRELINENPISNDGIFSDDNLYELFPPLNREDAGDLEDAIVAFIRSDFRRRYEQKTEGIEDVYKKLNPENDPDKKDQIDLAMKSLNLNPDQYLELMRKRGKLSEGKYGTLTNEVDENEIFGSETNTEVYDRLREIRDYLHDYEQVVRKNSWEYIDNPDEIAAAAFNIREALEALDKAWEDQ